MSQISAPPLPPRNLRLQTNFELSLTLFLFSSLPSPVMNCLALHLLLQLLQLFTLTLTLHFIVEPPPLVFNPQQLKCQTDPSSKITWQIFKDNNWTAVSQESFGSFSQLKVDKKVDHPHFAHFGEFGEFAHFYRCLSELSLKSIVSGRVLGLAFSKFRTNQRFIDKTIDLLISRDFKLFSDEIPVLSQLSTEGASTALHCKIPTLLQPFLKVDHWIKDGQTIKRGN